MSRRVSSQITMIHRARASSPACASTPPLPVATDDDNFAFVAATKMQLRVSETFYDVIVIIFFTRRDL